MTGEQILITGGTSGIGLAATATLAALGENMSRSVEKGAETLVWLATSADVVKTDGGYYVDMEWQPPSPQGQDVQAARRLWEISEAQCARSSTEARR
jgi:NAD(P)-dependent dehydrogenase (short-subunit alcohol dehydrogenase family)